MNNQDGGPAYPGLEYGFDTGGPVGVDSHLGMTLRDHFAAEVGPKLIVELLKNNTFSEALEKVGEHAYRYADAMLVERSKP